MIPDHSERIIPLLCLIKGDCTQSKITYFQYQENIKGAVHQAIQVMILHP